VKFKVYGLRVSEVSYILRPKLNWKRNDEVSDTTGDTKRFVAGIIKACSL